MHLSRPSGRVGLLAIAAALVALLVTASTAGAASIDGGTTKLDFKTLANSAKLTVSTKGANPKTKTGGTYAVGQGESTLNQQPSGTVGLGASGNELSFKLGRKTATLTAFTFKLAAGKGQFNAVVNKKGKAVTLFDVASQGKVGGSADFSQLVMTTSNMQLTKSGAAALNKALGITAPKRGQKDKRLKAKQKVGNISMTGDRSLTVTGGESRTVYDQKFVQDLRNCSIELSSVAPATAIPKDASAPEGGVILPINASAGGTLTADDLIGQVNHLGGTRLDRPAGNPSGKAEYHSPLTDFKFGFQGGALHVLTATLVNANNLSTTIGDVTGTLQKNLTEGAGGVTLAGELVLSTTASGTLSQNQPPLGADCPIPAGSKIGTVAMSANVS